jgi:transglutaminase-like putative cysteine protease
MGWRLRVLHTTRVSYSGSARISYNEARMTPLTLPSQVTLESGVSAGVGVPVWTYRDYWGTMVSVFDLPDPHASLSIEARATVETEAARPLPRPLPWDALRSQGASGRLQEFLGVTPLTAVSVSLAAQAREHAADHDPIEAASSIASWVQSAVTYMPGATGVRTSAQEAWDKEQGVCQDIAHLTVALLRSVGLPARYVSGYLHADPAALPGTTVAGQSHAWVEYWVGDWVACDPTNLAPVGERYVVVARARDYADVPPLKGIYHGAPDALQEVTVAVTRLALGRAVQPSTYTGFCMPRSGHTGRDHVRNAVQVTGAGPEG